ncbi:MAG: carbon-nitrogen hydrolase family protein [Bryobacteraceae bacterium]
MRCVALLLAAVSAWAQLPVRQTDFADPPQGWTKWSPRPEIAPRAWVEAGGALALAGDSNPAVYGGWEYTARGVMPGRWYRFSARYRGVGFTFENGQVLARLDWAAASGKRAGQPDFVYQARRDGAWTQVTAEAPAPPNAAAVKIQLWLANAPQATVWWDDITLEETPAPKPRPVTIASVNFRPDKAAGPEDSVRQFLGVVQAKVPATADLILLPEGITVVATGMKYADVAEPVPGRTTSALGEVARRRKAYIAAGIYEREGPAVYNTAVLLDRSGKLAGKYRKVYIPREEFEGGITPGIDYPVFQTDFGRVGMMICYDVFYADPARALALAGAEIILMPIWGGPLPLATARALENHVFLAASGYGHPTYIMNPLGEQIASAPERGTVAIATVDLNHRYADGWLGWMRARFFKELRLDIGAHPR